MNTITVKRKNPMVNKLSFDKVRVSASFVTPERKEMKQQLFIETYGGTPTLMTAKGKDPNDTYGKSYSKSQIQRYKEEVKIGNIVTPKDEDFKLMSSKNRRLENQKLKDQLQKAQEAKSFLKFLGKRERILK
mmetsp:Transcript_27103/g.23963  ORF Transcript_27103/g.23963 Transcript_27103/m.23963 type:complete len:132 (+) Transcript_27103:265-660(+)